MGVVVQASAQKVIGLFTGNFLCIFKVKGVSEQLDTSKLWY